MTDRSSIEVDGLSHHGLPIPTASRIGPLIATGGIRGVDAATGVMPDDLVGQARLMFDNVRRTIEHAGATCGAIIKMTVWIAVPEARAAVNEEWVKMFPDPASRPARHTLNYALPGGMLMQCDLLAFVSE